MKKKLSYYDPNGILEMESEHPLMTELKNIELEEIPQHYITSTSPFSEYDTYQADGLQKLNTIFYGLINSALLE